MCLVAFLFLVKLWNLFQWNVQLDSFFSIQQNRHVYKKSSLEQNTFSVLDNFVYWAKGLVFLLIFIFIKKFMLKVFLHLECNLVKVDINLKAKYLFIDLESLFLFFHGKIILYVNSTDFLKAEIANIYKLLYIKSLLLVMTLTERKISWEEMQSKLLCNRQDW